MKYFLAKFSFWGFTKPNRELICLVEAENLEQARVIAQIKLDRLNSGEHHSPNDRWVVDVSQTLTMENVENPKT